MLVNENFTTNTATKKELAPAAHSSMLLASKSTHDNFTMKPADTSETKNAALVHHPKLIAYDDDLATSSDRSEDKKLPPPSANIRQASIISSTGSGVKKCKGINSTGGVKNHNPPASPPPTPRPTTLTSRSAPSLLEDTLSISNETAGETAQENVRRTIVVAPLDSATEASESTSANSSEGKISNKPTSSPEQASVEQEEEEPDDGSVKLEDGAELMGEGNNGDHQALGDGATGGGAGGSDDSLRRAYHLGASGQKLLVGAKSSIQEELRKIKDQGSKLFLGSKRPLKRKRKKVKRKVKTTQTRQSGTTTVGYGTGFGGSLNQYPQQSLVGVNPISNTLRQLYPTLTNPQQLTSTVQRLIMSKLNPALLQQHLQQQQKQQYHHPHNQQLNPLAHHNHHVSTGSLSESVNGLSPNQLTGSGNLNELLNQWSSSEETPSYLSSSSVPSPTSMQKQNAAKMIPIEIIGLDPAVTNSILYGGESATSQSPNTGLDTSQMFSSATQATNDELDSANGSNYSPPSPSPSPAASSYANSLQAALAASRGGGQRINHLLNKPLERPKASSILHIHHFHTQASKAPTAHLVQQAAQQLSPDGANDEQQQKSQVANARPGSPASSARLAQLTQLMRYHQQRPAASLHQKQTVQQQQQQQVYVNDRGQLVYVSVEDQSGNNAAGSKLERPASASGQVTEQEQQQESLGQQPGGTTISESNNEVSGWPSNESQQQQQGDQQQQEYQAQQDSSYGSDESGDQQQQQQQQQQGQQIESTQEQQPGDSQQLQQQIPEQGAIQMTPMGLNNNSHQLALANLSPQNYVSLSQVAGNSHQAPGIFVVSRGQTPQQLVALQQSQAGGHENQIQSKHQRAVYVTTNGQTISVVGRGNAADPSAQQEQVGESDLNNVDGKQQQLLMVAYKPRHNPYRNATDEPSSSAVPTDTRIRTPYNEGQESNPITTKHLLPGGQQLLKGTNIVLRPLLNQPQEQGSDDVASNQQIMLARYRPQLNNSNFNGTTNRLNNLAEIAQQFSASTDSDRAIRGNSIARKSPSQRLQVKMINPNSTCCMFLIENNTLIDTFSAKKSKNSNLQTSKLIRFPVPKVANLSLSSRPQLVPIPIRMQLPDNRVPTSSNNVLEPFISNNPALKALFVNNNGTGLRANSDLSSVRASLLAPNGPTSPSAVDLSEKFPLLNGYGNNNSNNNNKSILDHGFNGGVGGSSGGNGFLSSLQTHQQNLINQEMFLKHLQQMRDRLPQQAAAQQQTHTLSFSPGRVLVNNNATKLNNDELLALLHDLKINNSTSIAQTPLYTASSGFVEHLNNNNYHQHQQKLNSALYNTSGADSNLVSVLRPSLSGRIKQVQVVSPNKFVNSGSTQPSNSNNGLHTTHNGFNNNNNNAVHHIQHQHHQQTGSSLSKDNNSSQKVINAIDWQQQQQHELGFAHTSVQPSPPTQVKKHPTVASDVSDFDDGSGISNIALAFIFMVSLVTLTIIAASMIYRHKRRSIGRCGDLPTRSPRKLTRNLTQRTKHFVRANFVNPNDVTSIKSINVDNTNASASGSATKSSALNTTEGNLNGQSADPMSNPASDACNRVGYLNKKTFGQSLSTFNNTPMSGKYQFTTQSSSEDSAADIKTLNTRIQKTSYLKTLISSPECFLLGKNKNKPPVNQAESTDSGAYYLNVRNKNANNHGLFSTEHNKRTARPTSPSGGESSSTSCHRLVSDSNTKKSSANQSEKSYQTQSSSESLSCGKHSNFPLNRKSIMSTIHSISDDGSKTSAAAQCNSPSQLKSATSAQAAMLGRLSKLNNNLPAPKHLMAAFPINNLEDLTKQSDSSTALRVEKL